MGEASPKAPSGAEDRIIGRVINDRFEVIDLIARGGMGRVYRAKQRPLGRLVALKILDPRYKGEQDPEFQTRFFLEASTAAKLSHPNTVTVFDYGKTTDDVYFIAMELVEGRTLSTMVKMEAPIQAARAINIATQIARSLREAHGLGVIHRDLKPANVLLTKHGDEDDFVKVLDFGLVKDLREEEELTQQGLFMGSPKYMSPEQIQDGDVDARTDVYALGVILYQMLSARVPFDRENQVQTLMAHVREAVPPLVRADGASIPPALVSVVMKCLAKRSDARFTTMNDLIAALKMASGGSPNATLNTSAGELATSGMRSLHQTPSGGSISYTPSTGSLLSPPLTPPIEAPPRRRVPLVVGLAVMLSVAGAGAWLATQPLPGDGSTTTGATPVADPSLDPSLAASPTAAPRASAATPAHLLIELRSRPGGAEVFVDERSYGATPTVVEFVGDLAAQGREVSFRFELAGHRSTIVTRTIQGDHLEVEATLARVGGRPRPRPQPQLSDDDRPVVTDEAYRDNPY